MGAKATKVILGGKRNLGRKPRAKDHHNSHVRKTSWDTSHPEIEPTAEEVLARPAYRDGFRLNQWTNWSESDKARLRILANAGIDATRAADTLGRNEKTIAYKAREEGLILPAAWLAFMPKSKYVPHPREKRILLNYPFIISVTRDRDADLLAVNALVPKNLPEHMRGDICQDILLAVYEGKVHIETLQKKPNVVRQYIAAWRNRNLERGGYGIVSFDPYGDDQRSWEEQVAAKADWDWNQLQDARSNWEAQSLAFTPATQFDDAYEKELYDERSAYAERGIVLHHTEVELRLSRGERIASKRNLVADRIKVARCILECGFELLNPEALSPEFFGESRTPHYAGRKAEYFIAAYQSQYLEFKIPKSSIRPIKVRISDHAAIASGGADLDTHALGLERVLRVVRDLAGSVGKYERIYNKWGDMRDLLNNGLEGFAA